MVKFYYLFKRFKIVAHPDESKKLKYTQMKEKLLASASGQVDTGVAKLIFFGRKQLPGESVSEFAFHLRELANDCGFEANLVDAYLRDVFQVSLINPLIRKLTDAAKKNTFDETVSEAMMHEQTQMKDGQVQASVNAFQSGGYSGDGKNISNYHDFHALTT